MFIGDEFDDEAVVWVCGELLDEVLCDFGPEVVLNAIEQEYVSHARGCGCDEDASAMVGDDEAFLFESANSDVDGVEVGT